MGCLTKEILDDPVYLFISQMEISHVFIDVSEQGELLKGSEVDVWSKIVDEFDEGSCIPEGMFDVL